MIILDYYDDVKVKNNSYFFSNEKRFITFLISLVLMFLNIRLLIILDKESCGNPLCVSFVFSIFYLGVSLLFFILNLISLCMVSDSDFPSYKQLLALKEKYELQRKDILNEHPYNFSIYTNFFHEIKEEILCDSFCVDSKGNAYILNTDTDFVLTEQEDKRRYHHIVDNRDGHTITVKELKEKYLYKKEEKKDD